MNKKYVEARLLPALVGELRRAAQRVVFTNGCFDVLHVGHARYLQAARELGDCLIVAINSDRTVRLLKGESRPLNDEHERAEMLAALGCVDYVTIFDDESPRALIAETLPDVLVKGGDYEVGQIHGREQVEAAGGRVVTLPFIKGKSSTSIINRMLNAKAVSRRLDEVGEQEKPQCG